MDHNIKGKKVWILERHNSPLKVYEQEDGGKEPYTFVGPCADFTEVNDNDRLYSKEDYLDHIENYLKEEINENSLLGELDHNEDYMVSMKNISHMIKDLWYDQDSGQVMIKIQLLDTRDGKDAKAIADAGAPIYISSRASGYIDESGNVTLERIYTYDIVYRPGFKNAKLKPVNEDICKKYSGKGKAVRLYEWKEGNEDINKSPAINKSNSDSDKKPNKNMEEYATKEDLQALMEGFDKYTKELSSSISSFKTSMLQKIDEAKSLHVDSGKNDFDKNGDKKPKKIKEQLGDDPTNQSGSKAPDAESIIEPSSDDDSAERNKEQNQEFMDKIDDLENTLNGAMDEKEALLDYIQGMADRVNGHGDYMNLIAQFCNKMADYMDKVSLRVNDVTDYGEVIAERVNDITDYTDMTSKRVNQLHEYSEKIAENQNKLRNYSAKNIKSLNESLRNANEKGNERMRRVIENKLGKDNSKLSMKKGEVSNLVDTVLESVKKKKIDRNSIIMETKYPFVKHLNGNTRSLFEGLDEIKKKRVSSLLESKRTLTQESVSDVIHQVNEDNDAYRLLRNIPKKYIPVWEGLDSKTQNQVIALSKTRDLRTDDEVELFWESLDFGDVSQNVSESYQTVDVPTLTAEVEDGLGYEDDDVDRSLGIDNN